MAPQLSRALILVAPTSYTVPLDNAYRYALKSPRKARNFAWSAFVAAVLARRPDLAYRANELLVALGGVS